MRDQFCLNVLVSKTVWDFGCDVTWKTWNKGLGLYVVWRRVKPFLPLIIMGSVRSLEDKIDKSGPWWQHSRNIREAILYFLLIPGCRKSFNTSLLRFMLLWADRDCWQRCNTKGGGLQCMLTTDGVILNVSLGRNMSAPQMLNIWLRVFIHVVFWESLHANAACALIS